MTVLLLSANILVCFPNLAPLNYESNKHQYIRLDAVVQEIEVAAGVATERGPLEEPCLALLCMSEKAIELRLR